MDPNATMAGSDNPSILRGIEISPKPPPSAPVKVLATVMGLVLLWILAMALLSTFCNGYLYSIKQPVPVIGVTQDSVTMFVDGHARVNISAAGSNKLQCGEYGEVFVFAPYGTVIEAGRKRFEHTLPLVEDAYGVCTYRGSLTYAPLGGVGPTLTYYWVSESFDTGR